MRTLALVALLLVGLLALSVRAQDIPDPPSAPDAPSQPDQPSLPDEPAAPEPPSVPEPPSAPEQPDAPSPPDAPAQPDAPDVPDAPTPPEQPGVPEAPTPPDAPAVPDPTIPDAPAVPDPNVPDVPAIPDPSVPAVPEPTVPDLPVPDLGEAVDDGLAAVPGVNLGSDNDDETPDNTLGLDAACGNRDVCNGNLRCISNVCREVSDMDLALPGVGNKCSEQDCCRVGLSCNRATTRCTPIESQLEIVACEVTGSAPPPSSPPVVPPPATEDPDGTPIVIDEPAGASALNPSMGLLALAFSSLCAIMAW